MNNTKVIPTFEERVMRNIAKLKAIIANAGFTLSDLNTADKTNLVAAINELKGQIDGLADFTITIEMLELAGLLGTTHTTIAYGDHDHEIGDMVVLFENKLV